MVSVLWCNGMYISLSKMIQNFANLLFMSIKISIYMVLSRVCLQQYIFFVAAFPNLLSASLALNDTYICH